MSPTATRQDFHALHRSCHPSSYAPRAARCWCPRIRLQMICTGQKWHSCSQQANHCRCNRDVSREHNHLNEQFGNY